MLSNEIFELMQNIDGLGPKAVESFNEYLNYEDNKKEVDGELFIIYNKANNMKGVVYGYNN